MPTTLQRQQILQKVKSAQEKGEKPDLSRACFFGVNLSGVDFSEADLSRTNLRLANLSRADLNQANLEQTNLRGASLKQADLRGANLHGANLREANLSGANLYRADLNEALYDDNTTWPEGFEPAQAGAIRKDDVGPIPALNRESERI